MGLTQTPTSEELTMTEPVPPVRALSTGSWFVTEGACGGGGGGTGFDDCVLVDGAGGRVMMLTDSGTDSFPPSVNFNFNQCYAHCETQFFKISIIYLKVPTPFQLGFNFY